MATVIVPQQNLITKINKRITSNEKFFSLEFYPPRTLNGTYNLYEKCDRFSKGQPLFCDVTCDKVKDDRKSNLSVTIASTAQNITMCDTMVQLNAYDLIEEKAEEILSNFKKHGLSTIMILMEDIDGNESLGDFSCTAELVEFIKELYPGYFTICVAGYPSCIDWECSYEQTMEHLIREVEAGADFIITQMVFDASDFFKFVTKCRENDISVPIIPGIFPIQSYGCIQQVARHTRIKIPDQIMNVLRPIKKNDASVLKYGIYLTVELCKILLQNAFCAGLHFYTLNRETATVEVLKSVGLWREASVERRFLPWKSDTNREGESVRPIFWSCRPDSYVHRTSAWEKFPNGRWGDSATAEFGSFKDYNLFFAKNKQRQCKQQMMWGKTITCLQDIFDVFVAFIAGKENKEGVKVTQIPWSEEELAAETRLLSEELIHLNKNGILTINSQPHVNAARSNDKIFGWGDTGGYVYQKAYLEFFCSEEDAKNLLFVLKEFDSINYHLVKASGEEDKTNCTSGEANVVTWGVFTGSSVIQPTVVDPVAFHYWKEEAFELWLEQWGRLYEAGSQSRKYIEQIHDTFYLVNLVDNDYPKGNRLFDIVRQAIAMRL